MIHKPLRKGGLELAMTAAAFAALTGCGGGGDDSPAAPPVAKTLDATSCAAIATGTYVNTPASLTATWVAAGSTPSTTSTTVLPAHCVVQGTINPRTGTDGNPYGIRFQLKLPATWNSRFFFQGGSGYDGVLAAANGTINSADGNNNLALVQSYAVVSTDGGHDNTKLPNSNAFGLDNQARIDFGYNAVNKTTETSKAIIAAAYGKPADHSYFVGCSDGGRQGMEVAETHPDYFDGVVAGSPVMDLGAISADSTWGLQQIQAMVPKDTSGNPLWSQSFTPADQALFTSAYLAQCDALDGVADGMVQNPAACHFDPAVLQCTGAKTATCWTAAQVAVVKAVVGGPVDSTGQRVRTPGYNYLRENPIEGYPLDAGWMQPSSGQPSRLVGTATSAPGNIGLGAASIPDIHLAQPNPNFNPLTLSWDTYPDMMTVNAPWLSNDPDMSGFKARGGKVIFTHGTGDPGPTYLNTVNYYNRLVTLNDGLAATQQFARLFLVPSMGHCSGGATTDSYDPLTAIVNWVEKGTAPATITATARAGNTALSAVTPAIAAGRTRPLCPYPTTATYKGSGDVNSAASFACQ